MEEVQLPKLEWHTEQRKINDLIPYERNPRYLTDEQKRRLTISLEKFGLVEIPAIDLDNRVIAGHQRCKVLQLLGMGEDTHDVRVPNRKLTEEEFREYNIRSNANTGTWDPDMLLQDFETPYLEELGIDVKALLELSPEIAASPLDDDVPELSERNPIVKAGDIFQLGRHRIICGDSTISDSIAAVMQGERAAMVFTDPPYNVSIDSIVNLGKTQHKEFKQASGEMTREEFILFLKKAFDNLALFSKDGAIVYVCMDWRHIYEVITAGGECFTEIKNMCVWVKDNAGMGTFYRSQHELIFVFFNGNKNVGTFYQNQHELITVFKNGIAKHINNFELGQFGRYRTNVWEYAGTNSFAGREKINHPTVKPVQLVVDAILDCSHRNQIVLDTFLGSGTTIIAAERTGRICCGVDLDERYIELTIRRYSDYLKLYSQVPEFKHLNGDLTLQEVINNK